MAETKHTPGPWDNVDEQNRPVDTGRRTPEGHRIVDNTIGGECIEHPYGSGRLYSREAYRSLIDEATRKAAPDMLVALRLVLALHGIRDASGPGGAVPGHRVHLDPKAEEQIRAAIAKAEGR